MNSPNKLLYPMLLVAAFSVTAFSMVGIATMTERMPSAHADVLEAAPPVLPRYGVNEPSEASRGTSRQAANASAPAPKAAAGCTACGVVESIRTVERKGSGSGIGAVAGGLTGAVVGSQIGGGNGRTAMAVLGGVGGAYAGNEIEKNVKKTYAYQVKVRMSDGTLHVATQGSQPDFAIGDKVRIENGNVIRRS